MFLDSGPRVHILTIGTLNGTKIPYHTTNVQAKSILPTYFPPVYIRHAPLRKLIKHLDTLHIAHIPPHCQNAFDTPQESA